MLTSGLTNAPLTKALLIYTIASSIALSLFDIKHLVVIYVSPHFWPYSQFWRALVWQVVGFTNSSEALFAAMLVYHLRVVERAWGKRKIAVSLSFIVSVPAAMRTICYGKQRSQAEWLHIHTTYANNDNCSLDLPAHHTPYTTLLPPILLALLLRPLSLNNFNYLPSGPTATIFALLAQYHATIPYTYHYRIGSTSTSSPTTTNTTDTTTSNDPSTENTTSPSDPKPPPPSLSLLLSDKSTTYLVAAQLALSQFPAMLLPSAVGWIVGVAWRADLLPGLSPASTGFRVPAWVVGEQERRGGAGAASGAERERYEDLRRRLEGEVAASASGLEGSGAQAQRRANTAGEGGGFVSRLTRDW